MILYCVDTSAGHLTFELTVLERWRAALNADEVGICDQVRLEILYSARSSKDYQELAEERMGLKAIPTEAEAYRRALDVQASLARVGELHHRSVKIADLLMAASAELAETVVWHYDEGYDRIAEITGPAH